MPGYSLSNPFYDNLPGTQDWPRSGPRQSIIAIEELQYQDLSRSSSDGGIPIAFNHMYYFGCPAGYAPMQKRPLA